MGLSDIAQATNSNLSDISQRPDHTSRDSRNCPKQKPITPRRGRLPCGQAAGAKRPCQLWMPLRQHLSLPKNVPQTTHKAILHASFVQRQTLEMSDIEPAAKPQLGPLVALNRSRYSLVPRVDVRQCRQTLSSQCFTGIFYRIRIILAANPLVHQTLKVHEGAEACMLMYRTRSYTKISVYLHCKRSSHETVRKTN